MNLRSNFTISRHVSAAWRLFVHRRISPMLNSQSPHFTWSAEEKGLTGVDQQRRKAGVTTDEEPLRLHSLPVSFAASTHADASDDSVQAEIIRVIPTDESLRIDSGKKRRG